MAVETIIALFLNCLVPHADTVGAGDSFTGSFVASILSGLPIHEAHKRAVNVSAYVCTQQGAMPALPEELTNLSAE